MLRPHAGLLLAPLLFTALGCGHHAKTRDVAAVRSPELEPRAEQEARASAPDGERLGSTLWGVARADDEFTDWRVQLEAGNCYHFGYAGDRGIDKFAMYIWDPADKRLDSARGRPPEGVFKHCATQNGMYRVQGKVQEGGGHYAVVVYKTKSALPPPPAVEPKLGLAETIEKQAAQTAPGATRVGDFFAGNAETSDWYTQVQGGKCYWFIGAGEPGKVKHLWLYLWDDKNHRITENRSTTEQVSVGYCAKAGENGMYKFQAKVDSGKGDYKVGVYAK
jgi:hypothetical protein